MNRRIVSRESLLRSSRSVSARVRITARFAILSPSLLFYFISFFSFFSFFRSIERKKGMEKLGWDYNALHVRKINLR